jgi:macrolide transport system ATP-binding/permease protein
MTTPIRSEAVTAVIVTVSNVSKSYGVQDVLRNVSLVLNAGDHIGLVGANGVGKSTLLKIMAGEADLDSGVVTVARGIDVGYLPQALPSYKELTINDVIHESQDHLRSLENTMRALEADMAGAGGDQLAPILASYASVTDQFERRGGYDLEYRIDLVLHGMKIGYIPRERVVANLSGGEKARVSLAALLLRAPDLLLLDEPTNHLDVATLEWLEAYLAQHRGALLIASHDRYFLNRTVSAIFELGEHTRELKLYAGNYDDYVATKTAERARWQEAYDAQQEEIEELTLAARVTSRRVGHNRAPSDRDKTAYKFFGERVQSTVSRNVRAAEEKLRRIRENPVPKPPEPIHITPRFDSERLGARIPLSAHRLQKSFGDQVILDRISIEVQRGMRVVLTGPNGSGKSTLLQILAGIQEPDDGTVSAAPTLRIGYLDQEQEGLDPDQTVFHAYREGLIGYEDELRSQLYRYALFTPAELGKKVGDLSIGQKRKLQIARLIALQPNFLLLDEPTNHVSLDTLEQFEAALLRFPGPILAVSHDRRFIERFAQEVWELRNGTLICYQGGFADFLASQTESTLPI